MVPVVVVISVVVTMVVKEHLAVAKVVVMVEVLVPVVVVISVVVAMVVKEH